MFLQPCFNFYLIPIYNTSLQPPLKLEFQQNFTNKLQNITQTLETPLLSQIEIFINQNGGDSKKSTPIKYMKLAAPYSNFKPMDSSAFKRFYKSVTSKYQQYYTDQKKKKSWGKNDITILLWLVHRLSITRMQNPKSWMLQDWQIVSSLIPFRQAQQCKFKWFSMRCNQLQDNPWRKDQIQGLIQIVRNQKYKQIPDMQLINWNGVSQEMFLKFQTYRTSKQCRQCWNIQMKSHHQSKKLWSKQQDKILIKNYQIEGRKWKNISRYLPGRSENAIKNRFNLLSMKGQVSQIQSQTKQICNDILAESTKLFQNDLQNVVPTQNTLFFPVQ